MNKARNDSFRDKLGQRSKCDMGEIYGRAKSVIYWANMAMLHIVLFNLKRGIRKRIFSKRNYDSFRDKLGHQSKLGQSIW